MRIFTLICTWVTFEVVTGCLSQPKKCVVEGIDMCGYKTHEEMISHLMDIEKEYPDIAKVVNIIQMKKM